MRVLYDIIEHIGKGDIKSPIPNTPIIKTFNTIKESIIYLIDNRKDIGPYYQYPYRYELICHYRGKVIHNYTNVEIEKLIKQIKMKIAIGVKMVALIAMTLGEYNSYRGWDIPEGEDPDQEGYLIEYLGQGKPNHPNHDNYVSWSPIDVADESYYQIEDGTRITKSDVDGFLVENTGIKMGEKTTVVMDTTITGFDMVASSPCVDPANYNQAIGDEYARKKNIDILWGHLGFVLQWAKNGLKAK